MKKQTTITYEGEVKDGWCGKYIGDDSLDDIVKHLEGLVDTGIQVKIVIGETD